MLESSLYSEQLLRDIHINRLHDPAGLDKLYDKLKGTPEERLQKKVRRGDCSRSCRQACGQARTELGSRT